MDEFNLLPIYRNGIGEITSGLDIPIPNFCSGKCQSSEKCKQHYMKMEEAVPGLYQCPFGFSSYVFKIEDESIIFTCLRVENEYKREKLIPKLKGEGRRYREITMDILQNYEVAYREFYVKQTQYDEYRRFVEDIFHDIRKFNRDLKMKNDIIFRKSQQGRKFADIQEASMSIQVMSWFMSVRLNNHDFIYNEQIMKTDVKSSYNIYKIIDKVRKCMKERASERQVNIDMNSNRNCKDMQAYGCIELLPYLLLDNAIKYSPEGETVHIYVEEKANRQHVQIKSYGPMASSEESLNLKKQGYRGINAKALTKGGMGIGLYTADCICHLNNLAFEVKSSQEMQMEKKGVPFSEFLVDIWIDL